MASVFNFVADPLRIWAIALSALCLAACASVPMASKESDAALKEFAAPPADKADLYVYRDSAVGKALKKTVYLDGVEIGETANRVYFYREINPGPHRLSTESEFSDNSTSFQADAGKRYFARQRIKWGVFVGGARIEMVDEFEGEREIRKCRLAQDVGGGALTGRPLPQPITAAEAPLTSKASPLPIIQSDSASQDQSPPSAVVDDAHTSQLRTQLMSTNVKALQRNAKALLKSGTYDRATLDVVADRIDQSRFTLNDKEADALSLLCKLVGQSGDGRYSHFMTQVSVEVSNPKIRKYAEWAAERLPIGTTSQFVPSSGRIERATSRESTGSGSSISAKTSPDSTVTNDKEAAGSNLDAASRLAQLNELRNKGLITESEYQAKRAEIMKSL